MAEQEQCGGGPPCGEGPGNAPVSEATYQCSLGVRLQGVIDRARRKVHELGFRPYRVSLVWQQFNRAKNEWQEVDRVELVPCRVVAKDAVSRDVGEGGVIFDGSLVIDQISPKQVTERQLEGWRGGEAWPATSSEREFFYEVQAMRRCPGDPEMPRRRFTIDSQVHFDGEGYQYRLSLTPQIVDRGEGGQDRSFTPPPKNKPRLKL